MEKGDDSEPLDNALGQSRGGFTTKLHLLADANGHPLGFHLTGGQVHDSTVVDTVSMATNDLTNGSGEPVAWPAFLVDDKGYRANWIDEYQLDLKIIPVIPSKENKDRSAGQWSSRRNCFANATSWSE